MRRSSQDKVRCLGDASVRVVIVHQFENDEICIRRQWLKPAFNSGVMFTNVGLSSDIHGLLVTSRACRLRNRYPAHVSYGGNVHIATSDHEHHSLLVT